MVPDEFVEQLRILLPHLEDNAFFHVIPQLERLVPDWVRRPHDRKRALRATVRECIAEMKPEDDARFRSPKARSHSALSLHYVDGFTIQEAARELAISERQFYRDLKRAEQDLAALLWARSLKQSRTAPTFGEGASPAELVRREAERLPLQVEHTSIQALVRSVVATASQLSQQHGLVLKTEMPEEPLLAYTDRVLARQALLAILSHSLQNAKANSTVTLLVCRRRGEGEVQIRYAPRRGLPGSHAILSAARQLVPLLGEQWSTGIEGSEKVVNVTLGQRDQTTILVIDNNEGLVDLFQRYTSSSDAPGKGKLRVIGAQDGQEGLRLAEEVGPDVIVLDVMMPDLDGWEVLQQLRSKGSTCDIPVIVCSVLDDPQLALSLGAADFMAKPVSRSQLWNALAPFRRDLPAPLRSGKPASSE